MTEPPIQLLNPGRLPKLGLQGDGSAAWLAEQGIDVPDTVFATARSADGGWVVRVAESEFLLEGGHEGGVIPQLKSRLHPPPTGVYEIPREEVTFILGGPQTGAALSQTCAIDFREAVPHRFLFTRVAGVSCGILPEETNGAIAYRLWIDPSYEDYLRSTLAAIVAEMGGSTSARG